MTGNVAVIVGSLRKESFTRRVANALCELAPAPLRLEIVEIGNLALYNQDLETQPPGEWVAFRDRIRSMDGVVFATPEYNRSIPGVLKNAIDVASRPYGKSAWAKKPTAVISVSPGTLGGFGANHHLRQCCVFLDMPCMQTPEAYVHSVEKSLDESGKLVGGAREVAQKFIVAYADWLSRFAMPKADDSAA